MSLSLTTINPSQLLLFLCKYLFMTFLLPNSSLYIFLQWGFLLVNLFMSPSKAECINCLYSFSNKKTALCCLVLNIKSCSKFSFFHDARCLFSLSTIKKKKMYLPCWETNCHKETSLSIRCSTEGAYFVHLIFLAEMGAVSSLDWAGSGARLSDSVAKLG